MAWLTANNSRVDLGDSFIGIWPELSSYTWQYLLSIYTGGLQKNVNVNYANPSNPIIGDSVVYTFTLNGKTYTTNFTGQGLNYDFLTNPNANSGTVTGFTAYTNTNGNFSLGLTYGGFSIPLKTLHTLVSSSSASDHLLWIDTIFSGNDTFVGGNYNDIFLATAGNDTIDGGAGINRVVYSDSNSPNGYKSTEFNITVNTNTIVVSDTVSNHFGTENLTNIQRLQFSDTTLAFDINGGAGQAYRLYQAAFGRTPDSGGLGYWIAQIDSGTTLSSVSSSFINSAEFQKLYGSSTSNASFVNNLYQNVLHRAGDTGGITYWNNQLAIGESRADVLVSFSESTENKAGVIGSIQNGIHYTEWTG